MRQDGKLEDGQLIAAIDLGSNSFHMVIARVEGVTPVVIDRLKEPVRLAAGLDRDKNLTEEAISRAIGCLSRFGQRIRQLAPHQVRAVGTNTMRRARNSAAFQARANAALGHEIDIIAGREEARLIFLGVALSDQLSVPRLVVDIGGGSTECVIGGEAEPLAADSLYMGCVSHSQRYFPDGAITKAAFKKAIVDAARKVKPIVSPYRRLGWQECLGSSGTIAAISEIAVAEGWSEGEINAKILRRLRKRMIEAGTFEALDLKGMPPLRRSVLAGGVAILSAVVDEMGIDSMEPAGGALREGVLADLLGRMHDKDVRDATVAAMANRFGVDTAHAQRVHDTAMNLFAQVGEALGLDPTDDRKRLDWATRLHEVGLAMTWASHHKHGAYLLENSDMPGFSRGEQLFLSRIVGAHRRKLPREAFMELPDGLRDRARHLTTLLRIAVVLNRARSPNPQPAVRIASRRGSLVLMFPEGWLDAHPLTDRDLEVETERIAKIGVTFQAV
jgi:exopolyphosphatase / guanosine-5'-triphosphate,3'-diphosphate pyrophosphatase